MYSTDAVPVSHRILRVLPSLAVFDKIPFSAYLESECVLDASVLPAHARMLEVKDAFPSGTDKRRSECLSWTALHKRNTNYGVARPELFGKW